MELLAPGHPVNGAPAPAARAALTPQQGLAVAQREVSVVLSSGAGCGKTHVLTERYLAHLRDDGVEVGQIVAITFTDRAARQMRERIRKAVLHGLHQAASDADADRWARHLRGLETAQISTIHAFCATLLRQNAVEAGLDPHFQVLEDVLATNHRSEALTNTLQTLLEARNQDLCQLVLLYGWRPTVEAIKNLIRDGDEPAWQTWLTLTPEQIAAEWEGPERARLLPGYVEYLIAACPRIARCLWLLRTTPCIGPQMSANVARLLRETPALAGAKDLAATVKELGEAAKVGKERAKAWKSEEDYEAVKKALEGFREDLPARLALFDEPVVNLPAAVVVGQRFVRVATETVRAYRRLKHQHGVLDFQDLLVKARDLLRDRVEVREQLQRRFRFLLVDELQDTDPVQMELVELLCGGGLTGGKLFAVGDAKQSIYRFRGADVHQFQKLRRQMPHEGRLGLTVNFRSQPAILDFANAVFAARMRDYEPLQAHHDQVNAGPCVEFLWGPRGDKENVNESRQREAECIARRIATMIDRPEALVVERADGQARLRPVRAADVVLLFRAMSNVHLYEAALRRHGLDYYLVGGRAFYAQQEIYDLLNLLRALENPQDGVCLAGTLRSPFCCLSDEALFVLSRHPDRLWAGLHDAGTCERLPEDQREPAARARACLDRWRALKDRVPIARLLGEVLADSGYDAALQFEFLGERKLANLWKLQELARTFDRSGLFGLAEFIERLGELVRNQPREEQAATQPESADVVRLMTIHQAKGLEFPIVIVPDLAATAGGPHLPAAVWDSRLGCIARPPADEEKPPFSDFAHRLWRAGDDVEEWHEDLRTLYVACTRAQDYLVLSAALPATFSPTNSWMLALAERFDLRNGSCLAEDISTKHVPRVRVISSLDDPALHAGRARERTALPPDEEADAAGFLATVSSSRDVAPIPLMLPARPVIPVTEVVARLGQRGAPGFRSADVTLQFDAEDGSDRNDWVRPRETLFGLPGQGERPGDRIVRRVLERWNFKEPESWRQVLQQADEPAGSEAGRLLARFAGSELFAELARAQKYYGDVEYLLELAEEEGAAPEKLPVLRGVVDCLWQDAEGGWHLGAFTMEDTALDANALKARFVLAARALRPRLGDEPVDMAHYDFITGKLTRWSARRLPHRQVITAVRKLLSATRRQPLPG